MSSPATPPAPVVTAPGPEPPARGIEVRSIDYVPLAERHGRVWHVAPVWVAGNANVGTVVVGFVGIAAGANLFWTLVAIVAGCGFGTIFSALHSTQGPRLGLPQLIQSRPQFGYLGALMVFAFALITYVGFNVFSAVLAGESLHSTIGMPPEVTFVLTGVIAGVIALVGYDWIHRVARWITAAFTLVFLVLTIAMLVTQNLPAGAFSSADFAPTAFLIQFGAAAGYQINWAIYVSDYTRYLPATVGARRMFWCTYLGMTLSAVWLAGLGALLAATFPNTDAVAAVAAAGNAVFPGFGTAAVLVSLIALLVVMAMNTYGGSLTLISMADTVRNIRFTTGLRITAVTVVTLVATGLSLIVSQDFMATFTVFLQVLLYLFAPWTAINLADYFLVRHGHYSIREIFNPHGLYKRWSWQGLLAYAIGFAAEIPFFSTTIYTGPIAQALNGADLSAFAGVLIGAIAYVTFTRTLDRTAEQQLVATIDKDLESV